MGIENLKFTREHEWIEAEGARRKVGITDFAQSQLGDIVYVEFPEAGKELKAGDEACIIESCKATASVYAPVDCKVAAVNESLPDTPETINQDPLGAGWLVEVEVSGELDEAKLMDAAAYEKFCEEEA